MEGKIGEINNWYPLISSTNGYVIIFFKRWFNDLFVHFDSAQCTGVIGFIIGH